MTQLKLPHRTTRYLPDAPTWLREVTERQDAVRAYAGRIEDALRYAGYDPAMLAELPPHYVAAALALGVR